MCVFLLPLRQEQRQICEKLNWRPARPSLVLLPSLCSNLWKYYQLIYSFALVICMLKYMLLFLFLIAFFRYIQLYITAVFRLDLVCV